MPHRTRRRPASDPRHHAPAWTLPLRIAELLIGLVGYGVGIALVLRGALGVAPWDVLAQGVSRRTGWDFGIVTIAVGAVVLLLWVPLRVRPGIGTVLNVLLVGPAADLGLALVPPQQALPVRIALVLGGIVVVAIASGLYLGARFGPGPRDGLMLGLRDRLGVPVWVGRTVVEGSVLIAGWLLGGDVGVGTIAFAVLIGPLVGMCLRWFRANGAGAGRGRARPKALA